MNRQLEIASPFTRPRRLPFLVLAALVAAASSLLCRIMASVRPDLVAPPDESILAGAAAFACFSAGVWLAAWGVWQMLDRRKP